MAYTAAVHGIPLERRLDLAASYVLSKDDAELRKVSPKLVKAKHMILDSNGIAQYKAGVDAIETLNAIVVADRLYGEKAATKIAAETGYNFKPLLDVMGKDAASLGLGDGLKLHEVYEEVVENGNTELHRLVTEMSPYSEIIDAAKNSSDAEVMGAARKVYDFDTGVKRAKREQMRRVSVPMLAASSMLTGGLVAGLISTVTLSMFSYGREALYRTIEAAPKAGPAGGKIGKAINKTEAQLSKIGFSIPYAVILGAEAAIGMPINWGSVLVYTAGVQGLGVAEKKLKSYSRRIRAVAKTLREGCTEKKFWDTVKERESVMEAEAQLEKGPEETKRGWLDEQMRRLNMMKFPVGKMKYVDVMKLGVGERLNEKEIIEEARREFAGELVKRYSPAVCNAILGEYLPNAKISESALIEARGASAKALGTTITESSNSARRFGTGEYEFSQSYCEQVAGTRMEVLKDQGYDCKTDDNKDAMVFHGRENGAWSRFGPARLKEPVLIHEEDRLIGTSVKYLEDAVKDGGIVQFPKLGKAGIEGWDLQDYKVYVSDLLDKEMAVPVLYHELTAHVGNRLEAFETIVMLGDALSRQQDSQMLKIPAGNPNSA